MNPKYVELALLDALGLCREQLPPDVHPIWAARLRVISHIITWAVAQDPQKWTDALARAERAVDQGGRQ